jgi:hypothetical protein
MKVSAYAAPSSNGRGPVFRMEDDEDVGMAGDLDEEEVQHGEGERTHYRNFSLWLESGSVTRVK